LLSKTLATVLAKRPCRVIVDSTPARPITGVVIEATQALTEFQREPVAS